MNSLVSLIIPTYNREEFLLEAIQSVIAQTYRPIECIVVDDGSTDNIRMLVKEISISVGESFSFQYIYQQNLGSQVARNTGTSASTGAFIQYLDSDDLLYPEKIERQVDYLISHPDCEGVFGDWQVGNAAKKVTIIAYKKEDFIAQILTERCIANFSFLMRREIVEKIGDWDINIKRNQEIDFHLRGILAGGNFEYQTGLCGLWRTHINERIVTNTSLDDIINFYQNAEKTLNKYQLFNQRLAVKIADLYMWLISQNKNNKNEILINVLKEVVRLNADIPFYNNPKMKALSIILGETKAMVIWLNRFRAKTASVKEIENE
jgi:glycosyltransferase involved in cell wall biosynthesis